jgi:hypothetical protein
MRAFITQRWQETVICAATKHPDDGRKNRLLVYQADAVVIESRQKPLEKAMLNQQIKR